MSKPDYEKIGLKVGLEIHQQLDTSKLFCSCPSILREGEPEKIVKRNLHVVAGEFGEVDPAALQAYLKGRTYIYNFYNDSCCLLELDEEPPHRLNKEALNIALQVALMLKCDVVDEFHIMRKTVIDGSNTSGFQRTALISVNGSLELDDKKVGILSMCLEEDAARIIKSEDKTVTYALDRLGIPLVEIATTPDIHTPEDAKLFAKALGDIFRATRVKRGIGTIRQDVNISIKGGARIEIKGVQELNLLPKVVENEVSRQLKLIKIKNELKQRNASEIKNTPVDISSVLKSCTSKIIKKTLESGGKVFALKLENFSGLLGEEVQPGRRMGTELSDYAKAYGAGGLFHSDELPAYGITEEDIKKVREELKLKEGDAFAFVADTEEICEKALDAVRKRANLASREVPEETRKFLPDGNSAYMRPLPGSARMYPETDLLPYLITQSVLNEIKTNLPKMPWEQIKGLSSKYSLPSQVAETLYRSPYLDLFNEIISSTKVDPKVVAVTFTNFVSSLEDASVLQEQHYIDLFKSFEKGLFSKEAIPNLLETWCKDPSRKIDEIIKGAGIESLNEEDLEKIIGKIISKNQTLIKEKGDYAAKVLMGVVMKEVRGKADGGKIMQILQKKINETT